MLKFSGFADLTSCLGRKERAPKAPSDARSHNAPRQETSGCKLQVARHERDQCTECVRGNARFRPDAQRHAVGPPSARKARVAGMRRSRH